MSNLENITQKIVDDATKKAEDIIREASEKKQEMINIEEERAKSEAKKILDKALANSDLEKDKIISSSNLKLRDEKLKMQGEILNKVFEAAKEKLTNVDDKVYKEFIEKKLANFSKDGIELVLQEGREKLFENSLYKISDEKTESGFKLISKKEVINFDFKELVDFYRQDLEGEIAKMILEGDKNESRWLYSKFK